MRDYAPRPNRRPRDLRLIDMKKAFSLIEILVGLGLFALLGIVTAMMLLSSARGARKAAAVNIAKNEGQYALNAMSQVIRFGKQAVCNSGINLDLTKTDDTVVNYNLTGGKIVSGPANLTSQKVAVTGCGGTVFTCSGRNVTICFNIDAASPADVTETAGILFRTTVVLRNWGI